MCRADLTTFGPCLARDRAVPSRVSPLAIYSVGSLIPINFGWANPDLPL